MKEHNTLVIPPGQSDDIKWAEEFVEQTRRRGEQFGIAFAKTQKVLNNEEASK